jgi:D-glycero-D-manno-heptose 1,7-bisphosphate phosphatase
MVHRKAALFLDRDGVINKNSGYVHKVTDFEFIPEIFEICSAAQNLGLPIVVITNQSGIGRGYFSEEDYSVLNGWMVREFLKRKIEISLVLHAPENPENQSIPLKTNRRKPSPVMFIEAATNLDLDLATSIMIGDSESDMIAAQRAGLKHRILIGKESRNSEATQIVPEHNSCLVAIKNIFLEIKEQPSQ